MNAPAETPAATIRRLVRGLDRATLGTLGRADGAAAGEPYASLVLAACMPDLSPVLLISALADHTKNLLADPRASLLFDGTVGLAEPLTGPRAGLQGRFVRDDSDAARRRYLARHPSAAMYAGFKDFGFWRMEIRAAHLVAGFGRIHWLDAAAVRDDVADAEALVAAEREIVDHMNKDHPDAVQLYATRLLGRGGEGWTLTGVDPEGADLRRDGEVARLAFAKRATDPERARTELVRLVKQARAAG